MEKLLNNENEEVGGFLLFAFRDLWKKGGDSYF